jgi:hypothetical protein
MRSILTFEREQRLIPYADSHSLPIRARVAEALPGATGSLFHVRLESQRAFETVSRLTVSTS